MNFPIFETHACGQNTSGISAETGTGGEIRDVALSSENYRRTRITPVAPEILDPDIEFDYPESRLHLETESVSKEAESLLQEAESRYHGKIYDNISKERVKRRPLNERLRIVGNAVMERTDYDGFVLGRRLVAAATELDVESRC